MDNLAIEKAITLLELNRKFPNAKSIEYDENQKVYWVETTGFSSYPLYSVRDLGLNCYLRDKYEVGVGYYKNDTSVYILGKTGHITTEVYFETKEYIPIAVCECILKSEGLWEG